MGGRSSTFRDRAGKGRLGVRPSVGCEAEEQASSSGGLRTHDAPHVGEATPGQQGVRARGGAPPELRPKGEPGGRVVGFVTSPPARRISGRGVVRWNGRSTLVPVLCVPKFCRVFQTAVLTVESKPPNGQNGDQDAG